MEKLNLNPLGLSVSAYDPLASAKMRTDTLNASEGTLKGYECKKCKNRGFFAKYREDGSLYMEDCSCIRTRKCIREMEESGLKESIRTLTFDAYVCKHPWQTTLKEAAQSYAYSKTGWLLMGGQSGCGKTHLCTAVCRQRLLDGDEVRYMPWREKIAELKALSLDSNHRTQLMDRYKQAQVLYIDDLYKCGKTKDGSAHPSFHDINLAFEIINYRYINKLRTLISTERTPEELVAIDEATGSRIIEMCEQHVYAIGKSQEKNYRLRSVVCL